MAVLGDRSIPSEPSVRRDEPAGIPGSCWVCAVLSGGITLQPWGHHSVQEQSVEPRAGARCGLGSEAGTACRLS